MKILNISIDNTFCDKNSKTSRRVVAYGDLVEAYNIIVPGDIYRELNFSTKMKVFCVGGGNKIIQFFNIYKKTKLILKEDNYDLITVQDLYYLALIGFLLSKKFNIGLEIQIHGFEKYEGIRKVIADFVLPRASSIRCVSQRLKKELINIFKLEKEKITVVPIYSEINKPKLIVDGVKKTNKFIFLTVGRFVPVKNIKIQIEAMREVVKKNDNIELWIVGDGKLKDYYKTLISEYNLDEKVKIIGWQKDLSEIYSLVDAFLLTSNYEGWGMVVVEAATYNLPIIMTDVGCAGEFVKNEESALIIPVGDKEKLKISMERIYKDNVLRMKLVENAKKALGKLMNKEETLKLYLESWKKAVKNDVDR